MKRTLAAAAIALAGVITTSAPANATPLQDLKFLLDLDQAGIWYPDPATAITVAQEVCTDLGYGFTTDEVAHHLTITTGLAAGESSKFTMAAITSYCPQQLPAGTLT